MRFPFRIIVRFVLFAGVLAALALVLVPGPHRVIYPQGFGAVHVGDGLFTDAPAQADRLHTLVNEATQDSGAFFGGPQPAPRIVMCTTEPCRAAFGLTGRALTIGDMFMLFAPSGVNPRTVLHERIHIDLHARMGIWDAIWPRYPSWFNEGLATHLSGTPNVRGPSDARQADWVRAAGTPLAWRRMRQGRQPSQYYGASARLVAELDATLGRDGLAALVARVAEGARFDAEYARALDR